MWENAIILGVMALWGGFFWMLYQAMEAAKAPERSDDAETTRH